MPFNFTQVQWQECLRKIPWSYVVGGYLYSCLLAGVFPELMSNWQFVVVNCLVLCLLLPVRKVVAFGIGQMLRILVLVCFIAYAWQSDRDIGLDDSLKYVWIGSEVDYVLDVAEEYRHNADAKRQMLEKYPYPFYLLRKMDF